MSLVRCDVRQCEYSRHGFCQASSIRVRPSNCNQVEYPDNTACATFVSGDGPKTTLANFEDGPRAGGDDFVEFVQDANSIFSH